MTLRDLIRENPVTAPPDTSLEALARKMQDERVGSVVIVDDRTPVGIVTDRDLALRTIANGDGPDGKTARDVMTEDPFCVDIDTGVFELTEQMGDHGVRRVPVLENGDLAGIITLDDLTRMLHDEEQHLSAVIAAESPAY